MMVGWDESVSLLCCDIKKLQEPRQVIQILNTGCVHALTTSILQYREPEELACCSLVCI